MHNKNLLLFFNKTTLGLFFGYLLSCAVNAIFNLVTATQVFALTPETVAFCKLFIVGFSVVLGVIVTKYLSQDLALSIPLVRLGYKNQTGSNKEILLDLSALSDGRIIELCHSHILDGRLVCPRFLVKELSGQKEVSEKAKNALENLSQLEAISDLNLRFDESDFSDIKESSGKTLKLARIMGFDLLTADMSRLQISGIEGVRIINLNTLAQALKPQMQRGESLEIQIQRYGKEEKQGVGYLEDGTMVVVNGGADFLGETIVARVVSIKHTASGRMIFCNANVDAVSV